MAKNEEEAEGESKGTSPVQEYINSKWLTSKLEDAVNACVKEKPNDAYAFLGEYMRRRSSSKITSVHGRAVFDSRGHPTVECSISTLKGSFSASVPSGASTGEHEAHELRDKDEKFLGKGVSTAVSFLNSEIAPALTGRDPSQQRQLDEALRELDGTSDKSRLGANAILAASIAVCRAGAAEHDQPLHRCIGDLAGNSNFVLPVPAFNVINGGEHAGNGLAMQEFMLMPVGASSFSEAMRMGTETYHNLKSVIKEKYGKDATNVGDEGGFAPNIQNNRDALNLLTEAIDKAGYNGKVKIAMDVAASEIYDSHDQKYDLDFKNPNRDNSHKKTGFAPTSSFCALFYHDCPALCPWSSAYLRTFALWFRLYIGPAP